MLWWGIVALIAYVSINLDRDFIRSHPHPAQEDAMTDPDRTVFVLEPERFDEFVALLDDPKPNPRLEALLSRPTVFDTAEAQMEFMLADCPDCCGTNEVHDRSCPRTVQDDE